MRHLVVAAAVLLSAPAHAGIDLHALHGPSWNCGRLRPDLPKSFRDKCAECEAKGLHFSQDYPERFSSAAPSQEELDTARGSCAGTEDTLEAAREKLREQLKKSKQQTTVPTGTWYAAACGKNVKAGYTASSSVNTGAGFPTKAAAQKAVVDDCNSLMIKRGVSPTCKVLATWNSGCGWIAIPQNGAAPDSPSGCWSHANKQHVAEVCAAASGGPCQVHGGGPLGEGCE